MEFNIDKHNPLAPNIVTYIDRVPVWSSLKKKYLKKSKIFKKVVLWENAVQNRFKKSCALALL